MNRIFNRPTAVAILLFAAALAFRFIDLCNFRVQVDERLWTQRAHHLVELLEVRAFSEATSFLGHPGVVPAYLMAGGQVVAERINRIRGAEPGDPRYLSPLCAARAADAVVSTLVVPVVYLLGSALVSAPVGLVAAVFIAFDPHHVALSTIAHLDAVLTLLVTLSILLYMFGERRGQVRFKLLAGLFWGLAISTKPIAAPVVAILLLYKLLRLLLLRPAGAQAVRFMEWTDVWCVVLGHACLGALYTRLWRHDSPYVWRLHIENSFADFIYMLGKEWGGTFPAALALAVALTCGGFAFQRRAARSAAFHLAMSAALLMTLLAAVFSVPQVLENIIRFWTWAFGLAGTVHQAYGRSWAPPAGGYAGLLGIRLPDLLLAGFVLGVLGIMRCVRRRETDENTVAVVLFALGAVVWLIPLSFSAKQTIRYALPVIPLLWLFAAYGWVQAAQQLATAARRLQPAFVLVPVCLLQSVQTLRWYPDYHLFFNFAGGGLRGAVSREHSFAVAGHDEAVTFLQQEAQRRGSEQYVMVMGDLALMRFINASMYVDSAKEVVFVPYTENTVGADYLLVFPAFLMRYADRLAVPGLEKVFSYSPDSVEVLAVYKVLPPDCSQGCVFEIAKGTASSAMRIFTDRGRPAIKAVPERHQKGYILRGLSMRVVPGGYRLRIPIELPQPVDPALPSEKLVLRLDLSSACSRTIALGELLSAPQYVELECKFEKPFRAQLRVYWFGRVPVQLGIPTVYADAP